MSMRADYQLEREQRRRIHLQRLRETVMSFYQKYQKAYQNLVEHDAIHLIPEEMERVRTQLSRISSALENDPEAAQQYSLELGQYIYHLRDLSNSVQSELKMKTQLRMEQLRNERQAVEEEAIRFFEQQWRQIQDPVVLEFAMDDLRALRSKIENEGNSAQANFKGQIQMWVKNIEEQAKEKAEVWKAEKLKGNQKGSQLSQVRDHIEQYESLKTPANQADIDKVLQRLRGLETEVEQGNISADTAAQSLQQDTERANEVLAEEQVRLELIRAMYQELHKMGFVITEKPNRLMEGGEDIVRFRAQKPSGNRFACSVRLDGTLTWKFDGYEGQACQKDIQLFKKELDSIYGMKVTDERITWQNPDRISANQKPIDSHSDRGINGGM